MGPSKEASQSEEESEFNRTFDLCRRSEDRNKPLQIWLEKPHQVLQAPREFQ